MIINYIVFTIQTVIIELHYYVSSTLELHLKEWVLDTYRSIDKIGLIIFGVVL